MSRSISPNEDCDLHERTINHHPPIPTSIIQIGNNGMKLNEYPKTDRNLDDENFINDTAMPIPIIENNKNGLNLVQNRWSRVLNDKDNHDKFIPKCIIDKSSNYRNLDQNSPSFPWYGYKSGSASRRRNRTIFTPAQLEYLEREFAKNKFVSRARNKQICQIIKLDLDQVFVWFQNRRAKHRKYFNQKLNSEKSSPEMPDLNRLPPPIYFSGHQLSPIDLSVRTPVNMTGTASPNNYFAPEMQTNDRFYTDQPVTDKVRYITEFPTMSSPNLSTTTGNFGSRFLYNPAISLSPQPPLTSYSSINVIDPLWAMHNQLYINALNDIRQSKQIAVLQNK